MDESPSARPSRLLPAPEPVRRAAMAIAVIFLGCVVVNLLPSSLHDNPLIEWIASAISPNVGAVVFPGRPDVWLIPGLEFGAVGLLIWRAVAIPEDRRVWWLTAGAASIMATAHLLYRLLLPLSWDGRIPLSSEALGMSVHVAKVLFFSMTFLALSLMAARRVGLPTPGLRLDGLIGGCAVLTVGSALLVPDALVYSLTGWPELTTILVAITAIGPIALLVGLIPLLGPSRVWWRMIIAAGLAALAAAFTLLPMAEGADARDLPSWLLWPAALQALAWTAWDRWPSARPAGPAALSVAAPTGFALSAVTVLALSLIFPQPPIVLALSFLTILLAVLRMASALRSAQRLNAQHRVQRQRLREVRDEALAATRARSDVIATLSHEIRTPLTSVIGISELLLVGELDAAQRGHIEHVRRTGSLILDLVNDVLDLATIDEEQLTLRYEPLELAEVLGDVVELLRVNADAKNIRLRADLDPACPEWVRGDATRLRQVLINLVGNAVKFTDSGEVTVEVVPAARLEEPDAIYFQVTDTGIGMPADQLNRLFRPYSRLEESGNRRRTGTGLGLSISQALVRRMGGEITVTTQQGIGSVFGFELVLPAEAVPPAVARSLAGRRITVIDGRSPRRDLLVAQLRRWGAEVAEGRWDPAWMMSSVDTVVIREDHPDALSALGADLMRHRDRPRPVLMVVTASAHAVPYKALGPADVVVAASTAGGRLRSKLMTMSEAPERVPLEPVADQRPLRILLAEDDAASRRVCQLLVQQLGHEIDVVPDGAAAVAAASSTAYDLVLMDSQMPKLDGVEAARAIRQDEGPDERVPMIALTGAITEADRKAYALAGMNGVLAKPIGRADLAAILNGVPRRARSTAYADSVLPT